MENTQHQLPNQENSSVNAYDENYSFDGTTYTYTDKVSNKIYVWHTERNIWIEKVNGDCETKTQLEQNVHQPNDDKRKEALKDGNGKEEEEEEEEEEYDSDDDQKKRHPEKKKIGEHATNSFDPSKGYYGYEDDTYTYTDSSDGSTYFWDKEKRAWFPKITDTFMAYYQMSYGFTEPQSQVTETQQTPPSITPDKQRKLEQPLKTDGNENVGKNSTVATADSNAKRKPPAAAPPEWFDLDDEHNTKVYVTNLPLDITENEFVDVMQKCGMVMKDLDTGKMKVKLYFDSCTKTLKGDALCTYIKKESVGMALRFLDGYDVRGCKIKVEKARFTMKGDSYNPDLKPKKRRKKDKEKMKKMHEKLFAWQPDKLRGERPKHERIVIVKNLFDPSIFDEDLGLISEYQQDLREECSKCGAVKKVQIYDKHPEGVAQISFKDVEAADACVQLLNNRWFSQRLISAQLWDGKTKYKIQETAEEEEARLKKWEAYLNSGKNTNESNAKVTSNDDTNSTTLPAENEHEQLKKEHVDEDNESNGTRSSAGSEDDTDDEMKK